MLIPFRTALVAGLAALACLTAPGARAQLADADPDLGLLRDNGGSQR